MSVLTSPVAAPARRAHGVPGLRLAGFLAGAVVLVPAASGVGSLAAAGQWWDAPHVVQKLVVWALLWEALGVPALRPGGPAPVGGALYWLQSETLRLPPGYRFARFARGTRRTPLDVALYGTVLAAAVVLLASGVAGGRPTDGLPRPVVLVLLAALAGLGLRDRTAFLAARPELYAVLLATFLGPAAWTPFAVLLVLVVFGAGELAARALGRPTLAPETVCVLGCLLACVGGAGAAPPSAVAWLLLPVAALAAAGPVLRRAPATLWLFRDAATEERFTSALVTPGSDWSRHAPPAPQRTVRAFAELLPRTVADPAQYAVRDGALVARVALGGAASSGRALLATVQHECDFLGGQLRVVEVAPARFGASTRRYRLLDAADGVLETGTVRVRKRR